MSELTYEDFKSRIPISKVLEDAGYHFNRRDGMKYPSFVRLDGDGRRIRGDKFIVTANGLCCFQPPEQKRYNIISFIQEHPELFAEYNPGMNKSRLVNLVCNRLLNQPATQMEYDIKEARSTQVFDESNYEMQHYDVIDWETKKKFYPFFKERGLDLKTQAAFAEHFFLATSVGREDGKKYTNLAFPYHIPSGGKRIVGLEERGRPRNDFTTYKGKAAGTNSVEGLWIANLDKRPLEKAERVYWFESGYDGMGRYQICRDLGEDTEGVYVSTGGSPTEKQFKGMIAACPDAIHYLGFDKDGPGQLYACNFAMVKAGREFSSYSMKNGTIVFVDKSSGYDRHEFTPKEFSYKNFCEKFGLNDSKVVHYPAPTGYKDWNDPLRSNREIPEHNERAVESQGEEQKGRESNDENGVDERAESGVTEKLEEAEEEERPSYGFRR